MRRPRRRSTTVPKAKPPKSPGRPLPRSLDRPPLAAGAVKPPPPAARRRPPLARSVDRVLDDDEKSLVDVLDSLLNQGVVLNADLILALANVDLIYLRLSALLCAADRVLPPDR